MAPRLLLLHPLALSLRLHVHLLPRNIPTFPKPSSHEIPLVLTHLLLRTDLSHFALDVGMLDGCLLLISQLHRSNRVLVFAIEKVLVAPARRGVSVGSLGSSTHNPLPSAAEHAIEDSVRGARARSVVAHSRGDGEVAPATGVIGELHVLSVAQTTGSQWMAVRFQDTRAWAERGAGEGDGASGFGVADGGCGVRECGGGGVWRGMFLDDLLESVVEDIPLEPAYGVVRVWVGWFWWRGLEGDEWEGW